LHVVIRAKEALQVRVVQAAVHVYQAKAAHVLVAGEAAVEAGLHGVEVGQRVGYADGEQRPGAGVAGAAPGVVAVAVCQRT